MSRTIDQLPVKATPEATDKVIIEDSATKSTTAGAIAALAPIPARAGAFTRALEDKLDTVEVGAQKNAPHLARAAVLTGDATSLAPSEIQFSDNGSALQTGNAWTSADSIRIADHASAFGQTPPDLNVDLDAVDLRPFLEDWVDGGSFIMLINRGSDSAFVQVKTVTRVTSGSNRGYVLGSLSWLDVPSGFTYTTGAPHNIVLSDSDVAADTFIGMLPAAKVSGLDAIFAKLDGTNFTDAFAEAVENKVLPEPEHVTLTGWRWRGGPGLDYAGLVADNDVGRANASQLWARPSNANLPNVTRYMRRDHVFTVYKDADNWIQCKVNQSIGSQGSGNERYFNSIVVTKGAIAINDAVSLILSPAFLTVDRISDAFTDPPSAIDVPTEKATADYVAEQIAGKGDVEDTVPFAASFRDQYDRTFVTSFVGNTSGQAFISSDNNSPAGLPSTVTDFLTMDQDTAASVDQTDELDKVAVGDWFRAKVGTKYIIARIAHITKALTGEFEFWFDTNHEIDETLQYDLLPNGAGEIRFYRQEEPAGVADGEVTTAKLAANAVTAAKVAAGAIVTAALGALSVTTAKIAALAVTTAKIADNAVTAAKIMTGAVSTAKLADEAVTAAKTSSATLVLSASPTATVATVPPESGTWADIGTYAETDHLYIEGSTNNGSDHYRFVNSILMSDVPSTGNLWIGAAGAPVGGGNRVQVRRKAGASSTLQISRAGGNVSAAAVRVYMLQPGG